MAELNDGRLPEVVSAASVNCETSSTPPATSCTLRFILSCGVGEDPQAGQLARHERAVAGVIPLHRAEQHAQPRADLAVDYAVHAHAGPGHALHDGAH